MRDERGGRREERGERSGKERGAAFVHRPQSDTGTEETEDIEYIETMRDTDRQERERGEK